MAGDLAGGLSRALTVLNFPLALGAIALAGVAGGPRTAVAATVVLCAVVAVPGVVDPDDLDARLVNLLPALGLALAVGLTVAAVRRDGVAFARRASGDRLRVVVGAALLVLALPWLSAAWGFHFPGDVFMAEEMPAQRDPGIAAVHLGFHHGQGGVLLAATALLLSLPSAGRAIRAYLSLMLAYGVTLAVQDGWNEQLWKRGAVDWAIPDPVRPDLSWIWLVIVAGGAAVYALWLRPAPRR